MPASGPWASAAPLVKWSELFLPFGVVMRIKHSTQRTAHMKNHASSSLSLFLKAACYSNPGLELLAGTFQLKLNKHTPFSLLNGTIAWLMLFFLFSSQFPFLANWDRKGRHERALLNLSWQLVQDQNPRPRCVLLIRRQHQSLVWWTDQALPCPLSSPHTHTQHVHKGWQPWSLSGQRILCLQESHIWFLVSI